ncbi:MAG: hypothetical protein HRU01_08055 [Myxococcales bacterium]|nr:hypothetical protein [Myxococcales bacterium]
MRTLAAPFLAAVVAALLTACVQEKTRPSLLPKTVSVELRRAVVGVGYQGVVFTPLDAGGGAPLGFSPSDLDIATMEARLPSLLAGQSGAFGGSPPLLANYVRQYTGQVSDGRRVLQTNFIDQDLVKERGIDWRNQRVRFEDAGPRFFQIWYDTGGQHIVRLLSSGS